MLDEELAAKLERAIANNNTIVAVNVTDRERIVALLVTRCPSDSANFAAWSSNSSRNNENEKLEIS